MGYRQGIEGGPSKLVLSLLEGVELFLMALSTLMLIRQHNLVHVLCTFVGAPMTNITGNVVFCVLADRPVLHLSRGDLLVTVNAGISGVKGACKQTDNKEDRN